MVITFQISPGQRVPRKLRVPRVDMVKRIIFLPTPGLCAFYRPSRGPLAPDLLTFEEKAVAMRIPALDCANAAHSFAVGLPGRLAQELYRKGQWHIKFNTETDLWCFGLAGEAGGQLYGTDYLQYPDLLGNAYAAIRLLENHRQLLRQEVARRKKHSIRRVLHNIEPEVIQHFCAACCGKVGHAWNALGDQQFMSHVDFSTNELRGQLMAYLDQQKIADALSARHDCDFQTLLDVMQSLQPNPGP